MGDAGVAQRAFGGAMLAGERQRGGVGVEQAGIDDASDPRRAGGVDHRAVLPFALTDLARRDQHQRVDPGERRGKGGGIVIVEAADRDAVDGDTPGRAGEADDIGAGRTGGKRVGDKAAELAGDAGDGDGHEMAPCCVDRRYLDNELTKDKYGHFC